MPSRKSGVFLDSVTIQSASASLGQLESEGDGIGHGSEVVQRARVGSERALLTGFAVGDPISAYGIDEEFGGRPARFAARTSACGFQRGLNIVGRLWDTVCRVCT